MKPFYIVACISIVLNILLIAFLFNSDLVSNSTLQSRQSDFAYLSPRIFAENQNDLLINFGKLRSNLREFIYGVKNRTGIYFEYLPSGTSIGVNEKEKFVPASLLKLPLAMGLLKRIDEGRLKSDQILEVKEKHIDKNFGTLWEKGEGTKLTVNELLHELLINSDNTAQHVLYDALTGSEIDEVFDSLDIPKEKKEDNGDVIVTSKNYSSILRCLYLSCYLSKEDSNELLSILTQTTFQDKLPAGVAENVKVAHKIGISVNTNSEDKEIYTDCGIVYVPKRPYILCIMVEGNEDVARKIMKDVSQITYKYVNSANLQ